MVTSPQTDWHRQLLAPFTPAHASVAKVTVLCDPDRVYDDPLLVSRILQAGFVLLRLEDPITFRLEYEGRFRRQWEQELTTPPLVVLTPIEQTHVPFDISAEVPVDRIRTVRLTEYFPALDGAVLQEIDRAQLAILWDRYQQSRPLQPGASGTADWLLLHLFELQPEVMQSEAGLLKAMLGHHYQHRQLAPRLLTRLVQRLKPTFPDWPLAELWGNRGTFLRFLGERWARFIASFLPQPGTGETPAEWHLAVPGPDTLPFAESSVRVYLDTLLLEGTIPPVRWVDPALLPESWMRLGLAPMTPAEEAERLQQHTETLAAQLPEEGATHTEWLAFADRFAEWLRARWVVKTPDQAVVATMATLHLEVERRFSAWFQVQFEALITLPAFNPVMVDKVAHHMARGWAQSGTPRQRRALLVLDGMSLMQWPLLREELRKEIPGLSLQESRLFAFVPSMTPISRQSLFSGEWPSAFPDSILTTNKEETHWSKFWQRSGALKNGVAFLKQKDGEDDTAFTNRVTETIENPAVRILGMVLGQIDGLTHGTSGILDSAGLQAAVQHWVQTGPAALVVKQLLAAGFTIWITADHGHVGTMGIGKPQVGVLAEDRSERVVVFSDPAQREQVAQQFAGTIRWPGAGLPADYHPLLAGGLTAFSSPDTHSISHGGISLEEAVVPFIKVEQVKA